MIRGEEIAPTVEDGSLKEVGLMMREGKLKSAYGPYRARDFFKVPMNREDGPIWTFERYGATRNELPDGRIICIGGEHEDSYDPDFCIYNDVVVIGPEDEIEIYGYPKDVFPPTDFHTATLAAGKIVIVGCLGNAGERRPGVTPVYSVDTNSSEICEFITSGTVPGWIFGHTAELSADGLLLIRGGQFVELRDGKQRFKRNNEEFSLNPATGVWTQITNRNWPQWSIRQKDSGLFILDNAVRLHDLIPEGLESVPVAKADHREARFLLEGVPIRVIAGVKWIEIVAEGELPEQICGKVPEVFRSRIEALCKKECIVE